MWSSIVSYPCEIRIRSAEGIVDWVLGKHFGPGLPGWGVRVVCVL